MIKIIKFADIVEIEVEMMKQRIYDLLKENYQRKTN
jgi:hypothetical protein